MWKINKKTTMYKRGFSLLEMVIIVAIITIMTATLMRVAFGNRDNKELEAAGREVVAAIREAQNNALTGKQQGSGLPCSFRFLIDPEGKGYKVQGSYRDIDTSCGNDTDDASYNNGHVFVSDDLSKDHIKITGYTSLKKNNASEAHETNFVVFGVPYGKYIDSESGHSVNNAVGATPGQSGQSLSIGAEFILEKNNKPDAKKYHICVHSTGLIDEIGFVDEDENSDVECVF